MKQQHHTPSQTAAFNQASRVHSKAFKRDKRLFDAVVHEGLSEEEVAGKFDMTTADVLKACLRHHAACSGWDRAQGSYYVEQISEGPHPRFKIKYGNGSYTDGIRKSTGFSLREAYLMTEALNKGS